MTKQAEINVLILTPHGDMLEIEVKNELESLQVEVDGYIQFLALGRDACLLVNEDAKQWPLETGGVGKLPRNERATKLAQAMGAIGADDWIAGPAVLVGAEGADFCSFPPDIGLATRALV